MIQSKDLCCFTEIRNEYRYHVSDRVHIEKYVVKAVCYKKHCLSANLHVALF